jgi:plasmid stabilization system protein ParE
MTRSKPHFAASIHEAPLYAARHKTLLPSPTISAPTIRRPPSRCVRLLFVRCKNLVLFPQVGRAQTIEGVRKLVTRKYPYLVYYTVGEAAEEIVILTIQHPAREREHEDV